MFGDGVRGQWLRAGIYSCTAPKAPFPGPILGGAPLSITSAPGTAAPSFRLCSSQTQMCVYHTQTQTHTVGKKKTFEKGTLLSRLYTF